MCGRKDMDEGELTHGSDHPVSEDASDGCVVKKCYAILRSVTVKEREGAKVDHSPAAEREENKFDEDEDGDLSSSRHRQSGEFSATRDKPASNLP